MTRRRLPHYVARDAEKQREMWARRETRLVSDGRDGKDQRDWRGRVCCRRSLPCIALRGGARRPSCACERTLSERCKSAPYVHVQYEVDCNCVAARRGGEQQETNDQSAAPANPIWPGGERVTPNAPGLKPFAPFLDGLQPVLEWDVTTANQRPSFQKRRRPACATGCLSWAANAAVRGGLP